MMYTIDGRRIQDEDDTNGWYTINNYLFNNYISTTERIMGFYINSQSSVHWKQPANKLN